MTDSQIVTRVQAVTITDVANVLMTPIAVDGDGLYVREIRIMGTVTVDGHANAAEVFVVRVEASERANVQVSSPASEF